jgi:hypothetical protein
MDLEPLVSVELIHPNETDVRVVGGLQVAAEACAGLAAEHRVLGVESFKRRADLGPGADVRRGAGP